MTATEQMDISERGTSAEEARIGHVMRLAVASLCQEGIDPQLVLAAAHAEIASALVAVYGGAVAARRLRRSADLIEDLPALADSGLILAQPMGRA